LHKNTQDLVLDHYLEVLARRPGALPAATALVTARTAGLFTPAHDVFWAAARGQHGDSAGTRVLIEVLLLHRRLTAEAVLAGMAAAVGLGRLEADLVAVEPRRHLEPSRPAVLVAGLTTQGLAAVGPAREQTHRPPPTLSDHDTLLTPLGASA